MFFFNGINHCKTFDIVGYEDYDLTPTPTIPDISATEYPGVSFGFNSIKIIFHYISLKSALV